MEAIEFSEWPGAWERHLIRRTRFPLYFPDQKAPTLTDLAQAQLLDKTELTQLETELALLVTRCHEITESSDLGIIQEIKTDLDQCYDTACGMGADLSEQKEALTLLNEVITTAIRRTLRDGDEHARLRLIKQESVRMRHLTRLNYPIVCDLLRPTCPIPQAELPSAMLSETDEAFTVALEVLNKNEKQQLADGIDQIFTALENSDKAPAIVRKQAILEKTLLTSQAETLLAAEAEVG